MHPDSNRATLARELAQRIASTTARDLTEKAVHYAKIGLLDTLGVAIAGAREEAAVIARRVAATEPGPSLLLGTTQRVSPLAAAFVNGIAANVLDFDDCSDPLGGHPSAPVLPALIALAESVQASGTDVLLAYVTGFETETQIARGVNFHHYEKGWHATATLGVFGAAAACSRLLNLPVTQAATALSLAASFSSGIKANLGSMAKPLHVGHCARNGLLAALLAREGFSANDDALEGHQGYLELFNGPGRYDIGRILQKWGKPFDIEMPGIAIKQHPCCLSVQSAVDAMLALAREEDIEPDAVARIESKTYPRRLEHTDRPAPRGALEAKLSIQYCLARALADRKVTLEHFTETRYRDPRVARLMTLVHAGTFEHAPPADNDDFGAEVRVTTKSGRVHTRTLNRPIGHDPGVPLAVELLEAKFHQCADAVLGAERAARVCDKVFGLENLATVGALTSALSPEASY